MEIAPELVEEAFQAFPVPREHEVAEVGDPVFPPVFLADDPAVLQVRDEDDPGHGVPGGIG